MTMMYGKTLGAVSALALMVAASAAMADTVVRIVRADTGIAERNAYYEELAKEFEGSHPGVDVQFEFIENEAFKQKLPTMLQSDDRPDIFYSWGGGVLRTQAEAGFLEDITAAVADEWVANYSAAGVKAFTVDGKIVGAPINASEVVFWVNKPLAAQVGIDPATIKTWADFLGAVQKAKDAGVTPIVVGGKEKWPLHFYLGYLALREAGKAGFEDAMADGSEGFTSPAFVKAAQDFKQLIDLEPFQPGFMDTDYGTASGMFGDGKAVFHLMGDWDYGVQAGNSASGKGLSDADLGMMRFPAVEGGVGDYADTFGGINGWAVAKGAKPEAIEFLRWLNGPEIQAQEAAKGYHIPVAMAAVPSVANPFYQQMAADLAASQYHQIFLDQDLGADVGSTFNDASADLASGATTPEDAMQMIQDAWEMR